MYSQNSRKGNRSKFKIQNRKGKNEKIVSLKQKSETSIPKIKIAVYGKTIIRINFFEVQILRENKISKQFIQTQLKTTEVGRTLI